MPLLSLFGRDATALAETQRERVSPAAHAPSVCTHPIWAVSNKKTHFKRPEFICRSGLSGFLKQSSSCHSCPFSDVTLLLLPQKNKPMRIATLSPHATINCGFVAGTITVPFGSFHGAGQAKLELPLLSLCEYENSAFSRIAKPCELTHFASYKH